MVTNVSATSISSTHFPIVFAEWKSVNNDSAADLSWVVRNLFPAAVLFVGGFLFLFILLTCDCE